MDAPLVSPALAQRAEVYWSESRQPLASLVFIAPLLATYEAGMVLLGPGGVRNGADAWLRQFLDAIGLGQYFLLPVLTVCLLLAWHHTTRLPWRLSRTVWYGMAAESILLALVLRMLLQLQGALAQAIAGPPALALAPLWAGDDGATVRMAIGFLGAGIYEELLFRLILLSAAVWGLKQAHIGPRARMAAAVLLTSLLFAAAHYVGANGEPLEGFSFVFRFLAGAFFAVVFVYRGFGIAVGAHAGYDLLVRTLWC